MEKWHEPAMLSEALEALRPESGGRFIDATLGDGGHAEAVLKRTAPSGFLLGIERDPTMVERATARLSRFKARCRIVRDSYENLMPIAMREGFTDSDGILFDLGVASQHFEASGRGFSFRSNEALDMRFDPTTQRTTASDIVNRASRQQLEDIFRRYGEEPQARRFSLEIIRNRPITSTEMLTNIITRASKGTNRLRIHPATRTFQALRIAVNDELRALESALPQAIDALSIGGVLVVLSYHSLEDRIVKQFFRKEILNGRFALLFRTPLRPSVQELRRNPRVRSARLRAACRVAI